MTVASVWIKLNTTVLGTTDLYEGCRVQAGQCGLLEYFLMEALPALSNDGYPGAKVFDHSTFFVTGGLVLSF